MSTLPKLDPRLKGILDDPYNYFRQYPDDSDKSILHKLVTVDHLWPQPADDKMPPHQVFRMEDGTRMPFTPVNREPKTFNYYGDFRNERWPVMLEPKERVQVALARFHELRAAAKTVLQQKQSEANKDREQVCSAVS